MGSIYKKQITRWKLDDKTVKAGTKHAIKVKEQTKKWYGQFKNKSGKLTTKVLSKDKAISLQMLAKLEKDVEREKVGLTSPFDDHLIKPLVDHLNDYLASSTVKGNSSDYMKADRTRITRILIGCSFKTIPNFDAPQAQAWVANQNYGVVTANHHIRAIKSFGKWLVVNRRMPFCTGSA